MRDPKTHAKILGLRRKAVGSTLNIASLGDDFIARKRLAGLHQRVIREIDHHRAKTGWRYTPPKRGNPGFWTYTEIDTEEGTP